MQFQSLHWPSYHGLWANIPCVRLKKSWSRRVFVHCNIPFVFTKPSWKDLSIFWGLFNEAIIPLALVGYEMIIANTAPRASLASHHLISTKREWSNRLLIRSGHLMTLISLNLLWYVFFEWCRTTPVFQSTSRYSMLTWQLLNKIMINAS